MTDLAALIERVETGEGEDAALSIEVNETLGIASYITDDGDPLMSLDAVLALKADLRPEWSYELAYCSDLRLCVARVVRGAMREDTAGEPTGSHQSPARALLAALLRAVQAESSS